MEGNEVLAGRLTIGDILAFNVYLTYLAFPITSLGFVMSIYQRSKTALERISPIVEEQEEKALEGSSETISENILEIKNLSFSFEDIEVLKEINLSVAKGEHIGLVGEVGSGKSVLFDIITRIYEPQRGQSIFRGKRYSYNNSSSTPRAMCVMPFKRVTCSLILLKTI